MSIGAAFFTFCVQPFEMRWWYKCTSSEAQSASQCDWNDTSPRWALSVAHLFEVWTLTIIFIASIGNNCRCDRTTWCSNCRWPLRIESEIQNCQLLCECETISMNYLCIVCLHWCRWVVQNQIFPRAHFIFRWVVVVSTHHKCHSNTQEGNDSIRFHSYSW